MAPKAQLTAQLQGISRFLKTMQKDSPLQFQEEQQVQTESILKLIRIATLDLVAAASALNALNDVPITSTQRSRCIEALRSKANEPSVRKQQDFMNIPNHLSKAWWQRYDQTPSDQRLLELNMTAGALGMRAPSEFTKALFMVVAVGESLTKLTPPQQHALYKQVSSNISVFCSRLPPLGDKPWVEKLPCRSADVDPAFDDLPDIAVPAVDCPVLMGLKALAFPVPVRSSNKASKELALPGSLAGGLGQDADLPITMVRKQPCMQLQLAQEPVDEMKLQTPSRGNLFSKLKSQLMLTDGTPEEKAARPLPALENGDAEMLGQAGDAEKVGNGAAEKLGKAAPKLGALECIDRIKNAAKAANVVAPKADDGTADEPEEPVTCKRPAARLKKTKVKAAEAPPAETASKKQKTAEAAPAEKASQATIAEAPPAETASKKQKAVKAAEAHPAEKASKKQQAKTAEAPPAEAASKKQKAVKAAEALPAEDSIALAMLHASQRSPGEAPSQADRAAMKLATLEQRCKWHVLAACHKCRWKKCTPSCWKERGVNPPSSSA